MVTELTPNIIRLLLSNKDEDIILALLSIGYNETKEDYEELVELLKPYHMAPVTFLVYTERYKVENIAIYRFKGIEEYDY